MAASLAFMQSAIQRHATVKLIDQSGSRRAAHGHGEAKRNSPWLGTAAVRAAFVEVVRRLEQKPLLLVRLTTDRQAIIQIMFGLH